MKHGKKLLSLFLSIVLLLGLLPTSALAAANIIEHLNTAPPTGQETWSNGSVIRSKDSSNNDYLGLLYLGQANTNTVITVDGTVTLTATPMLYGNVTFQGGASGGKIIFDTTGYSYKDKVTFGSGLFALEYIQSFTLKDITIEYLNISGPTSLFYLPATGNVTLDNVTLTNLPYEYLIGWSNVSAGKITLKNKLTINDSTVTNAHIHLGQHFSNFVLENYSSQSTPLKLRMTETAFNQKGDPFLIAEGATNANVNNFQFFTSTYSSVTGKYESINNRRTMYADGNIYLGSGSIQPTRTKWEVNLGMVPNGCTASSAMRQLVTKNNAMTTVTIDPGVGKTFAGVDISTPFTSVLNAAELRAVVDENGKLVISGTPTADVDLSSATWPDPVSNTKQVILGAELPAGVELATGDTYGGLTQNIKSWNEFKPVVLKAAAGYMFSSGVVAALNQEFEGIELIAALNDNGDIVITLDNTGTFNTNLISKNIKDKISTVAVEATVTSGNTTTKYATLSAAIDAANTAGSGTVEIKKATVTAVDNATLTAGVTLQDTTGNKYTAKDAAATVSVGTTGEVTLNSGALTVTPANDTTASVTVKTGEATSATLSGSDPFTVTAGDNASVAVSAGKQVNANNGLTFVAGSADTAFSLAGVSDNGTLDLSGNQNGDKIIAAASKGTETSVKLGTTTGESSADVVVKLPASKGGTVTKGDGTSALGYVDLNSGKSFALGGKTYTAAADNTRFQIAPDGTVKLTSGTVSLSPGQSIDGSVSGKTIINPVLGNSDTVTVEKTADYDEVTVPAGGKVIIAGKDYINGGTTNLVLRVAASGTVSVASGNLKKMISDGDSVVGNTSGATIANPEDSGRDTLEVTSDDTKDRVTVPAGANGSVTITKDGKRTTYTNGNADAHLFIDVPKTGVASLSSGSVKLDANGSIGVNTNTITNKSADPITVKKDASSLAAVVDLSNGQSFTDKDGNTYTANGGRASFELDDAGNITLLAGSATVEPAKDKTPTVNVRKAPNSGDTYPVSGSKPFTVTVGDDEGAKSSVTIPTKGESVTSGGLTFTAGSANAIFPLDGSKLNGNGDKLTVAASGSAEVEVGTKEGGDPIKVKIPADGSTNSGNTTITKGQPTIVTIGADGDSFSVNGSKVPESGYTTKAGEEYAIDANGYATKVTARLYDADGKEINAGSVYSMIRAATGGQTVKMERPSDGYFSNALLSDVTLKDTDGNAYKAVGGNAYIKMVAHTDDVDLNGGTLTVTPATGKTASVAVAKSGTNHNYTTVSGEAPFTVTVGQGNGSGEGENNAKSTVTIPTTGNTVTVGESAAKGMVFTAGTAGSTFPLDGSKLNNTGDSVKFGADRTSNAQVDAGNGNSINISNNVPATVKKVSGGHTVTLETADTSFTHSYPDGSGTGSKGYTAAAANTTFFVGNDGKTALASGAVKVSQTGSADVRPEGWRSSVSVSVPAGGSDVTISTVSGAPAMGKAAVDNGKSVTIGGKNYTAAAAGTAFVFDETGKVKLDSGKAELSKDDSILGSVSGVEIRNTSAEEAKKAIVEKTEGKDIVTVPAGGKVTIGGKEYTANSGEMKLEIDASGKVTLNSGKADFSKDTSLSLNGAEIKNTGNSALTMTESGASDKLDVKQGGSFSVGTGTVKDPSADMSFTIDASGNLTANLPQNGSVTINGVKYTGGADGATLTLDKNGDLTIEGSYAMEIPGSTAPTYVISGTVKQETSGTPTVVSGATVTLTKGDKEAVQLASVKTGADGRYEFKGVPAGTYNIVVTHTASGETRTMTKLVEITDHDMTMDEIRLPEAKVSSIVEVKPTSPVGAMVGGLDKVAEANKDTSHPTTTHVEVKLTVQDHEGDTAIADLAGSQTLMSLDFSVNRKSGGSTTAITETGTVLEIILTFDTTNKTNITAFRKHSGTAAALRKLDNRPTDPAQYEDGTYYVGNGFVVIYTSKFSPYAIGYDVVSHPGPSVVIPGGTTVIGGTKNGTVTLSPSNAGAGATVTVTVKPDAGYTLGTLTVTDKNGNKLTLTKLSDTQYTYVAPAGQVEVKAEFVKLGTDYASCIKDSTCPIAAFTDASPAAWYHDGLHYCLDNGLMNGLGGGKFAPDHPTTRAQVVTMLWRLNGSPVVNYALNFADVAEGAWYTEAIRWAKSTGVADGYGNGSFGPDDTITREQMVTILYRCAQSSGYDVSVGESTNILSFADATSISDYAFPAMQWACGSGMVTGMAGANGTMILLPQGDTARAQMATMLMRFCVEIAR